MKINLDSPVIVFLTTVADFMILNILFILCDIKYSVHFMLCAGHYDRPGSQCPLHDYYARGKT